LSSFIKEAGLPPDFGANSNDSVTIENVLEEKKAFDTSLNFEKLGLDDKGRGWTAHAPSKPTVLSSLPNRSNVLSVTVLDLLLPTITETRKYVAVTTADRKLHLLDLTASTLDLAHSYSTFQDSPILDVVAVGPQHFMVAMMSGKVLLYDTVKDEVLDQRRDHSKYVVKLATCVDNGRTWVASAGWDASVFLYQLDTAAEHMQLGEPVAVLTLPSIPETLLFVSSPDEGKAVLLVARRDSTFLHYYGVPSTDLPGLTLLGRQNLAPHSNAWIAFTPSDVQICPTDSSLVAIATSTTPHMKLLIARLLIPTEQSSLLDVRPALGPNEPITQASQARAELLIQDREEAAILVNVSTLAPQTQYSTPRLVWRPNGSGVYVSSDDGIVRGIEANTGKLISTLDEGHDPGSKLRCLWAGSIASQCSNSPNLSSEHERLISGGFDQKLVIWTP
jgi:WD40 repeat protein